MSDLERNLISYLIKNKNKIKINSCEIKKNDVFVALKGSKTHGAFFIKDALKFGAKYVITDHSKILIKSNKIFKTENWDRA